MLPAPAQDVLFEDVPNGLRALGKAISPPRNFRCQSAGCRSGCSSHLGVYEGSVYEPKYDGVIGPRFLNQVPTT